MYWKVSRIGSFFLLSLCDVWFNWVWKFNIVNLSLSPFWFVPFLRSLSTLSHKGILLCGLLEVSGVLFPPLFSVPPELEARCVGIQFLFSFITYQFVPLPFSESPFFPLWFECSPITCLILIRVGLFPTSCHYSAYWSCPLKLIKSKAIRTVWPLLCHWGLEQCEAGK